MTNLETGLRWLDLNLAQQSVWMDSKLNASSAYQLGGWARVPNQLDEAIVRQSVSLLMARHEALRIRVDDELPRQWIDHSIEPPVQFFESSFGNDQIFEIYAQSLLASPLPLGDHPLFRVIVYYSASDCTYLLWRFHHLIADYASISLAVFHWLSIYEALTSDTPGELTPPSEYSKTIEEDEAYVASAAYQRDLAYWKLLFKDLPAPLIPDLRPKPDDSSSGYIPAVRWEISGPAYARLQESARASGTTHQRALFALLTLVLARRYGQTDIVTGIALHRRNLGNRYMVGMLSGIMPLRCGFENWWSLDDCIRAFSDQMDASLKHQRLPVDVLSRELGLAGSGRPGLFEVAMSFIPLDRMQFSIPDGVTMRAIPTKEASPISFHITEQSSGLSVYLSVNPDFLPESEVVSLMNLLKIAFEAFIQSSEIAFEDLPILDPAEHKLVVEDFNRTEAIFDKGTLPGLFRTQARNTPDAVAIIAQDGSEVSYAELDRASDELARYLVSQGVISEQVVGVRMLRSAETIIAFLAILKAGGVYLPLDPAYPQERLHYIASDAGVKLILDSIPGLTAAVDLPEAADPDHLAYIIYTSGTTGLPKGVAVSHVPPVNLAFARKAGHDPIGVGDRILAAISVGFDVSIGQLLLPLLSGATVVIAGDVKTMGAPEFWAFLAERKVTHINSVPSFLDSILDSAPTAKTLSLKRLMLGGEALTGALVSRIHRTLPGVAVVNMYGPTEACIDATYHIATSDDFAAAVLPIGKPLSNYRAYIVDAQMQPVGIGVAGELYLGGVGLARGYVNAAELTSERFVQALGQRLYRTGDKARWRSDGVIEFLGRVDQQVKIRGFRVEPGEVAAVLLQHPSIAQAVVVPRTEQGHVRLLAYFVPRGDAPDTNSLRAHLAQRLPDYMVPAAFGVLSEIPLTANGKLDVKALPALDSQQHDYVAPRTPTQEALVELFKEILNIPRCGILDNFFELGGHSLLATRLVSKVQTLGVTLPLKAIFESPTIEALARQIDSLQHSTLDPIVVGPRPDHIPLSFPQERIWFVDSLAQDSSYNIPVALELRGKLDHTVVEQALERIVARHEVLRTRYIEVDGSLVQVVHSIGPIALRPESELKPALEKLAAHRFDLASRWPFDLSLVTLAPDHHVLGLVIHHIAFDGWSAGIFYREFAALYNAFSKHLSDPLIAPAMQYPDFALWQRRQNWDDDLAYWLEELKDAPPRSEFPGSEGPKRTADTVQFEIDVNTYSAMQKIAQQQRSSLFMVLHAAFAYLLARSSGQEDVVIGTAVANRNRAEFESVIGCFVNTLPLRTRFREDECFAELLDRVKTSDLEAFAHQDLPFEQLVQSLHPVRSLEHTAIFQVMFVLQNAPLPASELDGIAVTPLEIQPETPKFDFTLSITENRGLIEYAKDKFLPDDVSRVTQQFCTLLNLVTTNPTQALSTFNLLDPVEHKLVVEDFNRTEAIFDKGTLHGLFRIQARKTPDAVAIVAQDGSEVSYAELDRASDELARYLVSQGVISEQVVGVRMLRSAETIIAFLAILKAGGVYLPLDPAYPQERLHYIASDAGVKLILDSIHGLTAAVDLPEAADPDHLAYIIYTSGTTGLPKGVAVSHVPPVNLAFARKAGHDPIGVGDRILAAISVGFDVSIGQLLLPLLSGATVVIAGDVKTMGAPEFWTFLAERKVTHINSVPSFLDSILDSAPTAKTLSLKRLMLGGEALTGALVSRIHRTLPGVAVVNMYGPTEACIDATYHIATTDDFATAVLPIGKPLSNYRAYIVDAQMQPVGIGVAGELYLGGVGLARGYVNAAELTSERFVQALGQRLYRTGDKARWRSDGVIEFLGRVDQQVKIRGFRVEPGEIAAVLLQHPSIAQAVVVPRTEQGHVRLLAYFVPRGDAPDTSSLRAHLAQRLPDYMVPAAFGVLSEIPLTANGKLDVKALPALDSQQHEYVAPRTPTEEALVELFKEILNIPRCGILDNFFELGGHSLLATRLVSKVQTLGVTLPLKAIFESPTIEALARQIDSLQHSTLDPIVVGPRPDHIPLSFPQERIWFVDSLAQDSSYNIPVALELRGELDVEALRLALERILSRHEALRSRFFVRDGQPVQEVEPMGLLTLPTRAATEVELPSVMRQLANHRFNLSNARPFQVNLIALAPEHQVLVIVIHHVAFDGWSASIFYREFAALYTAFCQRQPDPLPPPAIQYPEFALWQRRQDRAEDLAYWLEELKDAPPLSELPGRDLMPGDFMRVPGAVPLHFDAPLHAALLKLAREHNASLFMVIHAAFSRLLSRWNGQDDIVIGTVAANRRRAEFESVIGCFVNTLPLRTRFIEDESFSQLLSRVAAGDLAAFAHQDLPFEQLFTSLGIDRSIQHAPVFQVMFILQNTPPISMDLPGIRVQALDLELDVAKFDLMLVLNETTDGIHGALEFAANRFDTEMLEKFCRQLRRLLEAVAADPSLNPATIDLLDAAEKNLILHSWNKPLLDFPKGMLQDFFRDQAKRSRDALAIVSPTGEEMTYRDLDHASDQLASYLIQKLAESIKSTNEPVVGVRMPRSRDTIICFLAILKAGAVYLPLDPEYPASRLDYMAADSGATIILDEIKGLSADAELPITDDPSRLAYIIYTSGTTGRPKGVGIPHASAVNLLYSRSASYDPVSPGDRVLAVTSVSFDMSIEQMLFPLLRGATVVVAGDVKSLGADGFWNLVARQRVTHIDFVPSFLESIFDAAPKAGPLSLKRLMLGGEAVSGTFLARIQTEMPSLEVVNVYGPTETCIDATYYVTSSADTACTVLPIGRPLPNYTAYVLDSQRQLVGTGIAGELYIGGAGLARGYINATELTAERFVHSLGQRLYRTGDRARWRKDGAIEFLGRIDQQVKIRGFRVELGEIAAALLDHPAVTQAVVIPRSSDRQTRLAAFIVTKAHVETDHAALRTYLAERLPDYMVPTAIVNIDVIPLNSNGKLDIKALPQDTIQSVEQAYDPPEGAEEVALQRIWESVLGTGPIGRHDNFFDLGGQSLTAIRLIHLINTELQIDLPMRVLFERPTISGLVLGIRLASAELRAGNLVPLRTSGTKPNLFCIHPGGGHVFCYFPLTQALGPDQPVYGIQARGLDSDEPLPGSIEEMASDYILAIQDVQSEGPYHLLGMSLGGLIAFEITRQLQARGQRVEFLALLDTTIPEDITVTVTDTMLLHTLAAEFGLSDLVNHSMTSLNQLVKRAISLHRLPPGFTTERAQRIAKVFTNMIRLQLAYKTKSVQGDILSIRALRRSDEDDRLPDWSKYTDGTVHMLDLDCSHNDLVTAAYGPVIADAVKSQVQS